MVSSIRRTGLFGMLVALILLLPSGMLSAQETEVVVSANDLPPVRIDALEGARWSVERAVVAPGQQLIITNRDVERHRFAVDDWDVDVALPTLEPVTVEIPDMVEPDGSYDFYSSEGDDRDEGMSGTLFIVTAEQAMAAAEHQETVSAGVTNRTVIEITDAFQFSPSEVEVGAGTMIELRNVGAIEHHFVVDAWNLNQTIPPGDTAIVQVPADLDVGESFEFYCSVPGHMELGMRGTLSITPGTAGANVLPVQQRLDGSGADLQPFLPNANVLGNNWSQVRSGNARSMISDEADFNTTVFPGEGIGAVYAGPEGSRATVIVMSLSADTLPVNQVEGAIEAVQRSMMDSWSTDRLSAVAAHGMPPPAGCDLARRASGIVPVLTLPAASTVCELRSAGVVIFVALEGEIDGESGIAASDELVARLLGSERNQQGE